MTERHDPRCFSLAEHFLAECDRPYTPATVEQLAELIQITIEDFIEFDLAMKGEAR